jgi:dihydroorotate dehydrogenase electron transfer subunit
MKKKTPQKNYKVVANNEIKSGYFKLALVAGDMAYVAQPGQFVMVGLNQAAFQPLLRRPMSIHSVNKNRIEIFYEVLGQGTRILAQKKPGEYLNLIGPLGNAFDYRLPLAACRSPILVAGGMGVAPLFFLAQKLTSRKSKAARQKPLVLIGAKTKDRILCEKEFKSLGCDVKIATDDGSRGFNGKVTDLLKNLIPDIESRAAIIYACGPMPMLKGVASVASKYGIESWGSFEAHMACGIGACMGCVIKTQNDFAYKRVCKEGPVFALSQAIWEKE